MICFQKKAITACRNSPYGICAKHFVRRIQKKNATTVYNSMGKLVKKINKINDKYGLIETMEREELCEWLNTLIRKTGLELADNVDITDEYPRVVKK